MNREEIKKEIQEIENNIIASKEAVRFNNNTLRELRYRLTQLKAELEGEKKKPPVILWKPKEGEIYWALDCFKKPVKFICDDCVFDNKNYVTGIISPTKKLAELRRNLDLSITEYKRKVAEFNGDWEPNWHSKKCEKAFLSVVGNNFVDWSYVDTQHYLEMDGMYFSRKVRENKEQFEELKKLYQRIVGLTKEYKEAEKRWRKGEEEE